MKDLNTVEVKTQSEVINTFKVLSSDIERFSDEIEALVNDKKELQHTPVILEIEQIDFQANELAILVEILTQNNIVAIGLRTRKQELIDFAKFSGLAMFGKVLIAEEVKAPKQNIAPKLPDKVYQAPKVVTDKVRASMQIVAKEGDLVLLNTVKKDAEVIAHGSISAYKDAQGKVFAGVAGDKQATIFIQSFNAQLVSIAGVYKTFDKVPAKLYARPVMISLVDDKLNFQIV